MKIEFHMYIGKLLYCWREFSTIYYTNLFLDTKIFSFPIKLTGNKKQLSLFWHIILAELVQ